MTTPIYFYKTKNLSNLKPSSLVAVKTEGDTTFSLYVTDNSGLPYPLKDNTGGGGGTIEAIINTDGNLTITGTTTKTINVSSSLLLLINSALQSGDNISELVNDANYITLADIPAFVASDYDLEDFTNAGVDPYAHLSDLSTGITNLDYITSPTQGIVTSDTGSDATIPLADGMNAGLLEPSKYTILENTSGTNTGDQDLSGKQDNLVSGTNIKTIEGQSLLGSGNIDLAKSDVGLSNVDNTSDSNKPISTATQSALDIKENLANKQNSLAVDGTGTKYPTVDAVNSIDSYTTTSGAVNVYNATVSPLLTSYVEGKSYKIKINITNTASSTINLNGIGAKIIKKNGADLVSNDIVAGQIYTITYDGVNFQMANNKPKTPYDLDNFTFSQEAENVNKWGKIGFNESYQLDLPINLGVRRNLWQYTEELASNRYATSNSTKLTDAVTFRGITLTRFTGSNFYSSIRSAINGLGITPFITGERYLVSYYIVSKNEGERFFWMRFLTSGGLNGHGSKVISNRVSRVWQVVEAISPSRMTVVSDPKIKLGLESSSDLYWYFQGNTERGVTDVYMGGFMIEKLTSNTYKDGIALIGDSTMAGASGGIDSVNPNAREVSTWLGALLNVNVYNRAVGGETTNSMDARWATDITPLAVNSKYVVIQGGINDIAQDRALVDIQNSINSMYSKAIADGLIPVFFTCTPTSSISASVTKEANRIALNTWMKQTFSNVIDIASVISDPIDISLIRNDVDWYGDGTHYGAKAKRVIADYISKWNGWEFITPAPYQKVTATTYTAPDTNIVNLGNITSSAFIKTSGTASQFLKADGSSDTTAYAPLDSPAFTGTPTAPTATVGTNTTQIATTAFVDAGLATKQNTLTNPVTGAGSNLDPNAYALQDGTILYHSVKWFAPTGVVRTSGTTVTSVGTQFTNAMVGAKLTINGEWRIITGYTSSTVVTVASAYSQNYSGVIAGSWGVYSKAYVSSGLIGINTVASIFFNSTGVATIYIDQNGNYVATPIFALFGNTLSANNYLAKTTGFSAVSSGVFNFSSTTNINDTKDLGIRRNSSGVLELYNGVTADGALLNRRDLLVRNVYSEPATLPNQVVTKAQLDLKADLASPTFTGTPTAPTATAGTNTTQIATTAFVTGANAGNVKLTGNQTISGQKSFSLTGKIDMQTNDAFPAISVTALGSNGQTAAEFINNSSFPNSTALRLQTGSSGGVGNRALDVSNQSSIGTGIFSNASSGGVSISSQSGDGDSYISNITFGGNGRNYVGRNNGTETYSVDKIGNVLGNSYIKRSTPATNILLAGGGDLVQGTAFNKNFGTTAGTVVEGNDSRFTDSRNPLPNSSNYIQNQNDSAQSANMWISGVGVFNKTVNTQSGTSGTLDYGFTLHKSNQADNNGSAIGMLFSLEGSSSIFGKGAIAFERTGGFSRGTLHFLNNNAADGSIPTLADSKLSITAAGAATFASTVTAPTFIGSATLTGTPTAPTAAVGTNTTQIATTAFVQAVDANVVHKTGNETISGYKSFDTSTSFPDIRFSFSSELASLNQNLNNFPIFRNVKGHLGINSKSSWGASISTALLTVSRNYTLPDVDGSIFIQGSVLKLKAYTVGTLPAGTVGDMTYVTDATAPTYNGTLTGGGAVKIPVFYDGTAWKAH